MRSISVIAAAIAMSGVQAAPALAGGGARPQAHGAPMQPPSAHQQGQRSQAHIVYGGPRLERRPDPNYQSRYRPMISLGATNPGELHPYFQTPKEGFGYPAARPSAVYQGNGVYFIPR